MLLHTMSQDELVKEMARDQPAVKKIEKAVKKEIEKILKRSSKNQQYIIVSDKVPSGNEWSVIGCVWNTRYAIVRICKLFNGKNISYLIFKPNTEAYILISSHAIRRFRERSEIEGLESVTPEEVITKMFIPSEFVTLIKANADSYLKGERLKELEEFMENDANFIMNTYHGIYIAELAEKAMIVKTYINSNMFENNRFNKYGYAASTIFYINNNRHLFGEKVIKICEEMIKSLAKGSKEKIMTMGMPSPFMKASGRDFRKDMEEQSRAIGFELKRERREKHFGD